MQTRNYARGTCLVQSYPWGFYHGGKAYCTDGKVRAIKRIASTADTFFSVPASVTVKGRTVAGYITVTTVDGSSIETPDNPAYVAFYAYKYRKNGALLPDNG